MTQLLQGRKEHRSGARSSSDVTGNTLDARILQLRREHGPLLVLTAVLVVAAVAVAILALQRGTRTTQPSPATGGPTLVSEAQLERLAAASDEPVYWVGPKKGFSYELTRTAGGRTYVRYLPAGVRAGDRKPNFLVVGTYTQPGSFADLQHAAKQRGALSVHIADHGLVVFSSSKPTSVYLSYPGANYQVEIYAPSGDTARRLVLGGKIQPVR
jgi:hypothetical protein